jgi:peptidoglycan/LPS O-acetylase OafA/YrhL
MTDGSLRVGLAVQRGTRTGEMVALTGFRGLAALWVFLYHAWGQSGMAFVGFNLGEWQVDLTPFFRMGGAGVSIFFVLSGFLLALPFAEWQAGRRDKPATWLYLQHRVLRVFPAYYVQLAILLAYAYHLHGASALPTPTDLLQHLFMLFVPPPLGVEPRNGVWWTLPIEFSFYLVLPLLAPLLRWNRLWLLVSLSLASMVLWRHGVVTVLAGSPVPVRVIASYQLPGSMDMFGIGMLAAVVLVNRDALTRWTDVFANRDRLVFLGIGLLTVAIYWLSQQASLYWADNPIFYLWTPALSLAVAGILLAGASGGRLANALLGNRVMHFMGIVSYSMYLWHFPVLVALKEAGLFTGEGVVRLGSALLVGLPLTLAVSAVSYYLVERPFMRMRRRERG